jgi:sugar phosphate permease
MRLDIHRRFRNTHRRFPIGLRPIGPTTAGAVADAVGLSGAFIIAGIVSVIAAVTALFLLGRATDLSKRGQT